MHIAGTINGMLENDHKAEVEAIANYNAAIKLSADLLDHGTKELLNSILKDEEAHLDFIEEQIDQIKQMGLEQYLTTVK